MIGESNHLGRDGIHFDLFIKVGRLNVTLSPATKQGPISPAISKWSASITHGWHYHHLLSTAGARAPPSFIFFYLSTYNLLKRSIFWGYSTDSFCKAIVQ